MRTFIEMLAITIGSVVFGLIAYFVLFILFCPLIAYECEKKWEGSGYESEYGFFSGCRVKVDNRWLPEKVVVSLLSKESEE